MFADQYQMDIEYTRICAMKETFEQEVTAFFHTAHTTGCNITVPFKTRAFEMADETDAAASAARAVNTLMQKHGRLYGYNTDGAGLVRDLASYNLSLTAKRVLLVGAGGAARGVIKPLLDAGVTAIVIANRTPANARELVSQANDPRVTVADTTTEGADLIINSSSASLHNTLPDCMSPSWFSECELAYDMVYQNQPTVFMQYAREQGATLQADGLGMLVEQAAEAFRIWTGLDPDTAGIKSHLRNDQPSSSAR